VLRKGLLHFPDECRLFCHLAPGKQELIMRNGNRAVATFSRPHHSITWTSMFFNCCMRENGVPMPGRVPNRWANSSWVAVISNWANAISAQAGRQYPQPIWGICSGGGRRGIFFGQLSYCLQKRFSFRLSERHLTGMGVYANYF
jgi:hypothetical protein